MKINKEVNKLRVLILEDDEVLIRVIAGYLKKAGVLQVKKVRNLEEVKELLKTEKFDLAFLDVYIDQSTDGLKALSLCHYYQIPAYMLSASKEEKVYEESFRKKCLSFLDKDIGLEQTIKKAVIDFVNEKTKESDRKFEEELAEHWITSDVEQLEIIKKALKYDWKKSPLFIEGETGVGKTALAKVLSKIKYGKEAPFRQFNSGGHKNRGETLYTDLFGYKKGAFTGANQDKNGIFKTADKGVVFFDEIGNIEINSQNLLVKVVDEKKYLPLGGEDEEEADIALIFATLKSIENLVSNGEMNKDFYQRINGFRLEIKPLRERRDDITLIIHRLMSKVSRKFIISKEAKALIYNYDWPGNVRELMSEFENWKVEAYDNGNILDEKGLSDKIRFNRSPFIKKGEKQILSKILINYIKKNGYVQTMDKLHLELVDLIEKSPESFGIHSYSHLQIEKKLKIPRRKYKTLLDQHKEVYVNN